MTRAGWAGWPFMEKKPPLVVRYEPATTDRPTAGPKTFHVHNVLDAIKNRLTERVDAGEIDEIVLFGPGVCTGWHAHVKRDVRFVERPTLHEQDAIAQRQAAYRILEEK